MRRIVREKLLHATFEITVILKGLHALLEIAAGIVLLIVTSESLLKLARLITRHELSEDPSDLVAAALVRAATELSISAQRFAALYLLSHGVIKAGLVAGLLRAKLWAYPAAIAVFTLFVAYQSWRFAFTHSTALLLFTVLDVVVIALTWHEYRHRRAAARQGSPPLGSR